MSQRYELLSVLSEGSYGTVFLANDRDADETVAVKVLDSDNGRVALKRIENEVRANVIIHGVRGVAGFRGHYQTPWTTNLVFDVVDGVDLFGLMESRHFRPLSERRVKKIMSTVAVCLSQCHQRGVAHRDIKLENIMIDKSGGALLVDWGLSSFFTFVNGRETLSNDPCGSVLYMPPEIIRGGPIQATKVDAWAMGVTMHCLLFGMFPYSQNEMLRKFQHTCIPLPDDDGQVRVSRETRHKMSQLLTTDPKQRANINILVSK
ncbi:hypothetical protein PROFUN_08606 [Planoprotostelium fungivorum]|uniref:Protein kinase domain-containing protein n=1 Tax=Planoprotostelium fungivorum TaxID=1890364 RepID=A0A2P6NJA2_9EUKA|nr:hypothetical protein PROFUN_08606 [Planoprotostelium fungivorum]